VFIPARSLIDRTGDRTEMPRNGTNSFCCGAGGGRMWMEEHTGKKVNIERSQEAVDTGADIVATGCPFCYVMMDDGVKELGEDENVQVMDVAMLLADRTLDD
jgi:Fe-S oxidoreductase